MNYDEVYNYIGQIGRYQCFIFSFVFIFSMYMVDSIHMIFIGGNMDHWCRVDELVGLPYDVQKNVAIPTETSIDGLSNVYSSCKMFALNYSAYNSIDFENWNRTEMVTDDTETTSCSSWTYDQSIFTSTIVSSFNLVCGRDFLVQLSSTLYMAGVLVGAVCSGAVSDRWGRKTSMLAFSCIKLCGNLMSIFGPNYAVFGVGRFLIGVGYVGYFLPGFALVMELVGPKYRSPLGCAIQIAFSLGFMLQPAIAYALRDEFRYQLAAVGPTLTFPFIIFFFIPESIRWLVLKGHYDAAHKQVQRICRINGYKLPCDLNLGKFEKESDVAKRNCCSLVSSPVLRKRAFIVDFSWFTCSLIYYALALNTGSLYGNIYINTFFSGAVEIPAYFLSIVMMDSKYFGRRGTGSIALIAAGFVSFICIPLTLNGYLSEASILSIIGKAVISTAYAVVYVFASEIFPTEVRSIGMGTGNMFSRIASMAASFVGGPLANVWKPLPSLVFGIFSTTSGLLYAFLPETLGHRLCDTIEEAECIEDNSRILHCCRPQASETVISNGYPNEKMTSIQCAGALNGEVKDTEENTISHF